MYIYDFFKYNLQKSEILTSIHPRAAIGMFDETNITRWFS